MFITLAARFYCYLDDSNRRAWSRSSIKTLKAETLEELYGMIIEYKIANETKSEEEDDGYDSDFYQVEFGTIYEVVSQQNFNEKIMQEHPAWIAHIEKITAEKQQKEAEKAEHERLEKERLQQQREEQDRQEYERLRTKYEK